MTLKRSVLFWVLTALVAAVVSVCSFRMFSTEPARSGLSVKKILKKPHRGRDIAVVRKEARAEARKRVDEIVPKKETAKSKNEAFEALRKSEDEAFAQLSSSERSLLEKLNEAMCADNLEAVAMTAEELASYPNAIVRKTAVEAISWFGERGLPELAVFLADDDEEVASLARDRWSLGVQEIEDDQEKVAMAKLGMLYVDDEDSLSEFAADLVMAQDDLIIMQALVDIIEEGHEKAAAAARDQYEWMTGDEWTDIETADAWLQENYEPSEAGDDASGEEKEVNAYEDEVAD